MKNTFDFLVTELFSNPEKNEHWIFSLESEDTQFIRLNQSQVRQIGSVSDTHMTLSLILDLPDGRRTAEKTLSISGSLEEILSQLKIEMNLLRQETPILPVDPYAILPQPGESSFIEKNTEPLHQDPSVALLREPLISPNPIDLAGILSSGTVIRANATTAGQRHWYQTASFCFDYSLYTSSQKALKNIYAGENWNRSDYQKQIETDRKLLELLERTPCDIPRGEYRVYLGPQAVHELLELLSFDTFSESAIRQQDSPFRLLRSGEKQLSKLFHLSEDFRIGLAPRFNEDGSLAPETFPLISEGKMIHTLISPRTAAEYRLESNGADDSECLRSPVIHPGTRETGALRNQEILERLGTGLYLSNLHYLNWSDSFTGRITGMTRYACFWVEKGQIQAPIQDLRFDESIFEIFGTALEALTEESWLIPSTATWGSRPMGGGKVPGILLKKMKFTL